MKITFTKFYTLTVSEEELRLIHDAVLKKQRIHSEYNQMESVYLCEKMSEEIMKQGFEIGCS